MMVRHEAEYLTTWKTLASSQRRLPSSFVHLSLGRRTPESKTGHDSTEGAVSTTNALDYDIFTIRPAPEGNGDICAKGLQNTGTINQCTLLPLIACRLFPQIPDRVDYLIYPETFTKTTV